VASRLGVCAIDAPPPTLARVVRSLFPHEALILRPRRPSYPLPLVATQRETGGSVLPHPLLAETAARPRCSLDRRRPLTVVPRKSNCTRRPLDRCPASAMSASPSPTAALGVPTAATPVQPSVLPVAAEAASAAASLPRPSGLSAPSPLVASGFSGLTDEPSSQCAAPSRPPESLGPIAPAVVALQPAPSPLAASADSAKCLAPTGASAIALGAQPQAHSLKDGRDNREKQNSSPSRAPIGSAQGAMLPAPPRREQPDGSHGSNSSPGLSGPVMMDLDSGDDAAAASAPPSAAASSSSAAASASSASSLPPAAPSLSPVPHSHLHPSRMGHFRVGGAAVAVPPMTRRSAPTGAASSSAPARRPKGALLPGLASMFSPERLQQMAAATEAGAAASSSGAGSDAASAAAAAPSLPSSSQPSLSHCLVFHPALFSEQGNDRAVHAKALDLGPHRTREVESAVASWQPALRGSMICAFVKAGDNRLHVQFGSRDSMEQALFSVKTLVPCCVTCPRGAWQAVTPCGPPRHDCAERIDIECSLVEDKSHDSKWIADTMQAVLDQVAIEETTHWMPASHRTGRFLLSVLARASSVAQLTETVTRINSAGLELGGHPIRAHAPNVPSLARCSQCSTLGHPSDACTEYRGVALRIQWYQPCNFATAIELQRLSGAQRVYLGHDLNTRAASRKLTLLFDDLSDQSPIMEQIGERLGARLFALQALLVDAYIVDLKNRLVECNHCGSMDRPHVCEGGGTLRKPTVNPRQGARRQPQDDDGAAAQPNHAGAAPARDPICRNWSRHKVCPRQQRGDRCGYQHPANVVIRPGPACFSFRDTGHCRWGDSCRFVRSHTKPNAVAAAAVAAAAQSQAQPPSPRAASAQAAASAASSAPAPARSPGRPPSSRKKATIRPQAASSAVTAASTQPRSDADGEEKGEPFHIVTSSRGRKAQPATPPRAPAPAAAAAASSRKKRKGAEANLTTPLTTPEQGAAAAGSAQPASSPLPPSLPPTPKAWADQSDSDGEGPLIRSRAQSSNPPQSSLSSLPSPLSIGMPKHTTKRAHIHQSPAAAAASSSSSTSSDTGGSSAQRALSFSSPAASPAASTAAASSPARHSSDAGGGKTAGRQ
jgi:hypothetical protein